MLRVKQLRFLSTQVLAQVKSIHEAIDEPEFNEAALTLINEWRDLLRWHRHRTLEGLVKVDLHRKGLLDSEQERTYLLQIEESMLKDHAQLATLTQRDLTVRVHSTNRRTTGP